ncbi:Beta-galactosidase 3 [Glycine soja]
MASVVAKLCCGSYVSNQMFHFSSFFRTEVSIVVVRVFPCRWRETCWIRDDNPIPDHDLCLCPSMNDIISLLSTDEISSARYSKNILFAEENVAAFYEKACDIFNSAYIPIENEYGAQSKLQGATGQNYVNWAAKLAVEMGTGVPWVMCKEDNAPYLVKGGQAGVLALRECKEWKIPSS